ncbi:hypothetical protein BDR22DRAFT_602689 [Usnea florida]
MMMKMMMMKREVVSLPLSQSEREGKGRGGGYSSHLTHLISSLLLSHSSQRNGIRNPKEPIGGHLSVVNPRCPFFLYISIYQVKYNMHPLCVRFHIRCKKLPLYHRDGYISQNSNKSQARFLRSFWEPLSPGLVYYVSGLVFSKHPNYPNNHLYLHIPIRQTTFPTISYTHKVASPRTPPSSRPIS